MYRTKTYIAGDWTGDQDLISQLYKWNNDDRLLLNFVDAHELTQARDTSLACSIKRSLSERLNAYYKGTDGKYYWYYQEIKKAILN